MSEVSTHIAINAPPAKVWAVLMDFPQYGKWNPFINGIEGAAKLGSRLKVTLRFSDTNTVQITPRIEDLTQTPVEYELIWLGKKFAGLFTGEHHFRVQASQTGCVFQQYEHFTGLFAHFMGQGFRQRVKERFTVMNQALKARAEMLNQAALAAAAAAAAVAVSGK